jgi:peptidyl-prolyl cis-trans isomerase A (cyclophilin A)
MSSFHSRIKTLSIFAAFLCLMLIVGCADKPPKELAEPNDEALKAPSPDIYKIKFETNEGDIILEVHREWSPNGADRLYHLVNYHFFDGVRFFRVVKRFMAQFGYHGDPKIGNVWKEKTFPDDPVQESNLRGYLTFAKSAAPNSRSTNLFINYKDNSFLDNQGFSPLGKVIQGMEVVDKLYGGYGDAAPRGKGPSQAKIMQEGNAYLNKDFPEMDYIKKARVISN